MHVFFFVATNSPTGPVWKCDISLRYRIKSRQSVLQTGKDWAHDMYSLSPVINAVQVCMEGHFHAAKKEDNPTGKVVLFK